ncbi:penicillin acylase family protein [Psychrobacter sp. T6-1]|uniref:penicillin acylase family protein n=1 Tax=Psychrobacter sp. T6-1 TaxID=3457447 RepID=UPI003FD58E2A
MTTQAAGKSVARLTLITIAVSLGLSGCSDNDVNFDSNAKPEPKPEFSATIQRTEFGIPHITADDYKGLGYGVGYAFAEDNFCSLAREVVVARGESMLYLGDQGNEASDVFYTWYNSPERRAEFLAAQDPETIDAVTGYAAGFSRYLRDTGAANIDPACANAEWVREITLDDLLTVYGKANLRGGLSNFVRAIVAAAPPADPDSATIGIQDSSRASSLAPVDPVVESAPEFNMETINVLNGGSNAYAFGSDYTGTDSGVMYGNPHEPWEGVQRFYEFHTTIPGELDVMGSAQQGQPFINIGFNKDVAWSHTVSTAKRFTLYQVSLVNNNPLKYNYINSAGAVEQLDIEEVEVMVQMPDGQDPLVRSIYVSKYGPMINAKALNPGLPAWGDANNVAYTIRDAASENPRALNQWRSMNMATSVEDLVDRMQTILGLGFVNTIATDRNGKALYADISTVPNVTAEKLAACSANAGAALPLLIERNLPALNGSTAACEWGNDADSPQAGIFGGSNLPFIIRDDYALNSNDSYWLSNAEQPLTGFSPLLRRELLPFSEDAAPLSLRTRMAFTQIFDRVSNDDGLGGNTFNLDKMEKVVYSNRSYGAELVLDDVLANCQANPTLPLTSGSTIDGTQACNVLSNWDRRNNLDSKGAHVFRKFWTNLNVNNYARFSTPFDKTNPINTPRDLIINDSTRRALGDSIAYYNSKNIALDAPLGSLQFVFDASKNNEKIPMHGGFGGEGVFNVASSSQNDDGTYGPVTNGPTYMQAVTFDRNGPVVDALLAFSQAGDTTRPFHRDQTRRYSDKEWIRLPFSASEIQNKAIGSKLELQEDSDQSQESLNQ